MSYTPGPWSLDVIDDESKYNLPNGPIYQIVAKVRNHPSTVCIIENVKEIPDYKADIAANANLIAQAPAMLKALKFILEEAELAGELTSIKMMDEALEQIRIMARTVIAQAEGDAK